MKRLIPFLLIIVTLYSCKKDGKSSLSNSTIDSLDCSGHSSSHWTFNGNNYCGIITTNDTTDFGVRRDFFKSSDDISDSISIMFWSDPVVSSSFAVNKGNLPTPQPNTCTIFINHGNVVYVSTGGSGNEVINVTIDPNTITALFSNITMLSVDTSYTISNLSGVLTKH